MSTMFLTLELTKCGGKRETKQNKSMVMKFRALIYAADVGIKDNSNHGAK